MAVREQIKEEIKSRIKEPRQYQVLIYNDDFTPMDFVVDILRDIFHKDEIEAVHLMMKVHESGRAAVGAYPRDIAATRIQNATARAREEGFPFRLSMEET